jgi:hypothetical protein
MSFNLKKIKNVLTSNWYVTRWVRLGFAIFLFSQAYILQDWMFIVFGAFFLIQAIFNLGCCTNSCSISKNGY